MTDDRDDHKTTGGQDDEDAKERVDRELIELLNELRIALPGVQVLFAFLLTLPFTQSFGKLSGLGETAYIVALLSAAMATALFIMPTSMHRLAFREGNKKQILSPRTAPPSQDSHSSCCRSRRWLWSSSAPCSITRPPSWWPQPSWRGSPGSGT